MPGMLDSWLASILPGYGGVTSMAGGTSAPSGQFPPSGMLANLLPGWAPPDPNTPDFGPIDVRHRLAQNRTVAPDPASFGIANGGVMGAEAGAFPPSASTIPLPLPRPSPTAGDAFASAVPPSPAAPASPAVPQAAAGPLAAMASAAPAGGPGETPPVPQTSLLGRLGSLFGDKAGSALGGIGDALDSRRNTLMALGAGLAGAPTLGTGLSRGLSGAIPASQLDIQQGRQNSTLKFLKSRGMSDDQANMVVSNPTLMAQLAPQIFGAKQLTATSLGTDVLGHAIPGMMNPVTGEHFDIYGRKLTPGGPAGGPGGGLASIDPAKWAGMAPEERLATMDPQVQGEIKAIYEGRQAGTGRNVQQLLPLVNQVYPDFTMQDYKLKQDTQHSFTGQGKNALELKAANTAIYHADNLDKPGGLIDKLDNFGMFPGVMNPAAQAVKKQFSPEFQATKGKYDAQVEGLAGELSKAFNGGQTASADREHWREVLNRAKSPAELHAAVSQSMEMLHGRLSATAESYNKGMGSMRDGISFLDPANQSIFKRIRGIDQPAAGSPAATAAIPSSGGAQAPPATGAPVIDQAAYASLPKGSSYIAADDPMRTPRIKQ